MTTTGGFPSIFLVGMFMSLFVVYGFDTAGTFGEETLDASRQAPRGILSAIWLAGATGALFLLAIILSFKDVPAQILSAQQFAWGVGGANPIGDTINSNMGDFRQGVPVRDPRRGLRLHPGDPGRHHPPHVLDGPRQAAPGRWGVGTRGPDLPDPGQCGGGGRHPRGDARLLAHKLAGASWRSPRPA